MSEETKAPTPPPSGEPKDSAGKPTPLSVEPVPAKKPGDPTAPATPGAPGAPPKAAAPHAPAGPPKPTRPTPEPWDRPRLGGRGLWGAGEANAQLPPRP